MGGINERYFLGHKLVEIREVEFRKKKPKSLQWTRPGTGRIVCHNKLVGVSSECRELMDTNLNGGTQNGL